MPLEKNNDIDLFVISVLKSMRTKQGISEKELAFLLEVSIGFIGNVENPKYRAKYNLTHINELAKIFRCSPRVFLPENAL